jgi:hypothetical protein
MASTDLVFSDEAAAVGALKDVRSNNNSVNWVLFTYSESNKNTLDLVGKGAGGVDELKSHLSQSKMFYGLVRVTEKIDNSVTVKFVFIIWCGSSVPFVQKAKMTTHKGSITNLIGQFHIDINCSEFDELSEEIIMRRVHEASGTYVHVKDAAVQSSAGNLHQSRAAYASHGVAGGAGKSSATAKPVNAPGSTSVITFVDEDAIKAAIKAVRSNNDETDWLLLGYEGNSTKIHLVGQGSHGLEELISHLKLDQVFYGLFRTTDTVDNTIAIKFVFIIWVGEQVPFSRKARITTHKGEVTSFIGQYHVDCNCSNLSEINDDIIRDLVQRASGTKSTVK